MRGYLPTLDGWRAVAILMVMAGHVLFTAIGPASGASDPSWYGLIAFGGKGVDLFFGISGFLICSRLIEEHAARGAISLKDFYIRRSFRIFPPVLAYLGVLAVLTALGLALVHGREWLPALLFYRNYVFIPEGRLTGHLWSLAVEEHFYLLFPALLAWWAPGRAAPRIAAFAVTVAIWRRVMIPANGQDGYFYRTDTKLDALLWGCWIALIIAQPGTRALLTRWLSGGRWLVLFGVTLAILVFAPPLGLPLQSLLIPIVIAGTVLRPDSVESRILEWAPLRWIGRISYSLYLWQQLFIMSLDRKLGLMQTLPFNIAVTFAVAAASYYWLEKPMIRLGHRLAAPVSPGRLTA